MWIISLESDWSVGDSRLRTIENRTNEAAFVAAPWGGLLYAKEVGPPRPPDVVIYVVLRYRRLEPLLYQIWIAGKSSSMRASWSPIFERSCDSEPPPFRLYTVFSGESQL